MVAQMDSAAADAGRSGRCAGRWVGGQGEDAQCLVIGSQQRLSLSERARRTRPHARTPPLPWSHIDPGRSSRRIVLGTPYYKKKTHTRTQWAFRTAMRANHQRCRRDVSRYYDQRINLLIQIFNYIKSDIKPY